jgi:glycerol-3-phosphate dehydrogenase
MDIYDVAVIGDGVNGCGIARDAAGRGAGVLLLEAKDLASGTFSASSKLIHGGLRFLEHYEFAPVRESLTEREVVHVIQIDRARTAEEILWRRTKLGLRMTQEEQLMLPIHLRKAVTA